MTRPAAPRPVPRLRPVGGLLMLVFALMLAACNEEGAAPAGAVQSGGLRRAQAVDPARWVAVPAPADPLMDNLTIPADAPTRGLWSPVQSWPLNGLHAAVLPDGKVLSFGTTPDGNTQNGRYFDLWNPALGLGAASHQTRFRADQPDSFCGAATYLPDGRLLITGGNGSVSSALYATAGDTVTPLSGNLADERWYATMLTLPTPLKVRFVPPEIEAGPLSTLNDTGRPEEAVAASPTISVVTLFPMVGKSMVWSDFT